MKQFRKAVQRLSALVMSLIMALSLNPSFAYVRAEETVTETWTKIELAEVTADDTIAVTMTATTNEGVKTFVLPSASISSAVPEAKEAFVEDDQLTTGAEAAGAYSWTVTAVEGGWQFVNSEGSYLYTTNANNGVRIGATTAVWSLDGNYLSASDTAGNTRYLGVYTANPDWRAYKNTTGNTAGQTVSFWKLSSGDSESTDPAEPDQPEVEPDEPEEEPETETTEIAAARSGAAGESFTVKGTVTYVSGKNIYVQDETGGICLYYSTAPSDVTVGSVVTATGTRASYKGLEELSGVAEYTVEAGNPVQPKTVTLAELTADQNTGSYECTSVLIENVTLGEINASGNTPVTDSEGNTINIYKSSAFADRTEGDVVTIKAVVGDFNGYQLYVVSEEDVTLVKAAGSDETPDPEEEEQGITSGTYVIWAPVYGKALSSTTNSSGYYLGVDVTGDKSTVTGYGSTELWKVEVQEDGTYLISQGTAYLGTTAKNKLTIAESPANKNWTAEENGDYINLKCNGTYLEWYSNYSDWSTYTSIKSGSEDLFRLYMTPATMTYSTDADVVECIAQWSGSTAYADDAMSISGDRYTAGDMKDAEASFTAVVDGVQVKPYTTSTSTTTGSTNYYMGGTGLGSGSDDYMQFEVSTAGWGDMTLSFRLRGSNTASGEFQLQYSTDGRTFADFSNGAYSCSYTDYSSGTGTPASLSGDITDGKAKTSIKPATYISFSFAVPDGAENAEHLYIRLVPSTETNAKGSAAPGKGGVVRIDNVALTGHPIVDDSITSYVTADPDGSEDQTAGTEITLSSEDGAVILYRFNGEGEYLTYDSSAKPVLPELPAVLEVKAQQQGKQDSVVRLFSYAAGSVESVRFSPNGGGIYLEEGEAQSITLSCATEGAVIYYSEDEGATFKEYTADTQLTLEKGFGEKTLCAYAEKDGYRNSAVVTRKFTERTSSSYTAYFGQLHSHTSYSDGAGSCEDAFEHASTLDDSYNIDFLAVTDHSNSFDNAASATISDGSVSEEWTEGKALAEQYTSDDFVGIFGFEMTWSNGLGHINTYNTDGFQSRTQSEYSTYSTALQNYYATLKTESESLSQFNHPGTTFGDFSDFSYYDEDIDQLITLIEVGNGEGAIGSSSYFPSYEYYTRALDKGWHVAPSNNQDNHKGNWGDANTARTVVWADSLSEEDIYDAVRNYRVYATEDCDLTISYSLDENFMGSILEKDGAAERKAVVTLEDPNDTGDAKIEVIVNGGLTAASTTGSCNGTYELTVPGSYSYYYIKITQADGNIAVTAPVWVGDVEAAGISSFTTTDAVAVQNQALDLNVDLYNNEKSALEISDVKFTVGSADGEVIKELSGAELEEAGLSKVAKLGTASYSFEYIYDGLGTTDYYVTVTGTLNGTEKVYTEKLEVNYVAEEMVTNIVVDGTHYNDYVTGYYGGNMSNFTQLAADEAAVVTIAGENKTDDDRSLTEEEWKELLEDCSLLIVSAPARASGTANAGDYVAAPFEDWFIALVADYVQNGGNLIVCGLADYSDKKASEAEDHIAAQLNKLLEACGSTMRINDDEALDPENNGGQPYRLYPETLNTDSEWLNGVVTAEDDPDNYQTYSQYSGATVSAGEGTVLVSGFATTCSADTDNDGVGNNGDTVTYEYSGKQYTYPMVTAAGEANFLVAEDTEAGGTIFAAGGVFVSDFEVDYEVDNIWDLPYANTTIAKNIISAVKKELPISTIAEVREAANAGEMGEVFRVQGYVTAGTSNEDTSFFDGIYIQDETGGIDIFPYAESGLALGTKVEVTGYIDSYQGDLELRVISTKILEEPADVIAPTEMSCKDAMDYETNGGRLIQVTGTVKKGSLYYNADGTLAQFVVTDEEGNDATIFIDGYIRSGTTGENTLADTVKEGAKVSAAGILYMHPEVFVEGVTENVPVLRVRDTDEIQVLEAPKKDDDSKKEDDSGKDSGDQKKDSENTKKQDASGQNTNRKNGIDTSDTFHAGVFAGLLAAASALAAAMFFALKRRA